jgi:hypothetical protein
MPDWFMGVSALPKLHLSALRTALETAASVPPPFGRNPASVADLIIGVYFCVVFVCVAL